MPTVFIKCGETHLFTPNIPMFTICVNKVGSVNKRRCLVSYSDGVSEPHDTGYGGADMHEGLVQQREANGAVHRITAVKNISDSTLEIQYS